MDSLKQASQSTTEGLSNASQQAQNSVSQGASQAQEKTTGQESWDAMTDSQKQQTFDSLPADQKKGKQTYTEWVKEGYQHQKENWMPWIEDLYLKWFTKDNKASYATKDTLNKSKVTGVEQVDQLQDGVHGLVAGQVGQGGLLQPVGDAVSKEGVNRAERQGKDEKGGYLPSAGGVGESVKGAGNSVASGAQSAGSTVTEGAKGAGGYVGGLFGGGKKEGEGQ